MLRENAPQLLQDVWNHAEGGAALVGPLRGHALRPDLRAVVPGQTGAFGEKLLKQPFLVLPNEATNPLEEAEAGARLVFTHIASNVFSIAYALTPREEGESSEDYMARQSRQDIYRDAYNAIATTLRVKDLAEPEDFAGALGRTLGQVGGGLAFETLPLAAGIGRLTLPAWTSGLAAKFPTFAAKAAPIVNSALTFGVQGALEPENAERQALAGLGAGAALGIFAPYGRMVRTLAGAGIGYGQESLSNPNSSLQDRIRNATLMAAFGMLSASEGLTFTDTVIGTLFDYAREKGATPEALRRALRLNGIGLVANEFAEEMTSRFAAPDLENRSGVIAVTRPGEEIGTVEHTTGPPDLQKIGFGVQQILSSEPVRQLVKDSFGIDNLQVHPIQGMWMGKPEPSFVLYGDNLTFDAADELSKLLGWAFNQDSTIVTMPHAEGQEGIPAIYALSDSKLTPYQANTIIKSANEKGLDFSTTIDNKGIKFLHFGGEEGFRDFAAAAREIAQNAGLSSIDTVVVRSQHNEVKDYVPTEDRGNLQGAWHRDSGAGPSSLFRRAVDNLLAPYIRLIEQEGYRFSTLKFADLFGHSNEEARLIEEAVHPKSEGTPPEGKPPSGQSGFK